MFERMLFGGPMFFMVCCSFALMTVFCNIYDEKKKNKGQIIIALVLMAIILILDSIFVDFETASTSMEAPMYVLGVFLFGVIVWRIPKKDAFYCAVWVYLTTDVLTQVVMPFTGIFYKVQGLFANVVIFLMYITEIVAACFIVKNFLVQKIVEKCRYHVGKQKLLLSVFIFVVYAVMSNYQFIFWLMDNEPENSSNMITAFRLILGIFCFMMLYMQSRFEQSQRVEQELDTVQQLLHQQQNQYHMSKENIELINRKCHDLRHQIAALKALHDERTLNEQINEMEKSIMIYDTAMKTGNTVLDTVLTEKCLFCEKHQINMTCMVDGTGLDFIGKVDLYTMFGNALDNAIETVMKYKEKEKRVIQVSVFSKGNLQMIRIRNYCKEKLNFEDGLPVSTKKDKDYHGYGLKSIRYTAEKYGGGITCVAGENYFSLQILLPMPGKVE